MSDERKQLTGRRRPLVRLWDRDFNPVHSYEGDLSAFFDDLRVTVDDPEDGSRKAGRLASVDIEWLGER